MKDRLIEEVQMSVAEQLQIGEIYTRKQLSEKFAITDATIRNGVFPYSPNSVWLFVTEQKTSDMTQYSDILNQDTLHWDGQTMGRTDYLIIQHKARNAELLVFYRKRGDEYPGAGFRYEGPFEYVSHSGSQPTHFVLQRQYPIELIVQADLDAIEAEDSREETLFEGGQRQRYTNYYERNPRLRAAAITCHGTSCMVCGFNFGAVYGQHGEGYIEVHHLQPVSTIKQKTVVDPRTDMAVVCSNCHRMIHRRKDVVLSIEQLKRLLVS